MGGEGVHNPYDDADLLVDIAALQADVDEIQVDVDVIRAVTDAEAVLENAGGTLTADGTEQGVFFINNPAGLFKPLNVKIDFTNQTMAETAVIRTYYRIIDGGGLVLQDTLTLVGAQDPELINIELEPNRFGLAVTLEITAGGFMDYVWEANYEV